MFATINPAPTLLCATVIKPLCNVSLLDQKDISDNAPVLEPTMLELTHCVFVPVTPISRLAAHLTATEPITECLTYLLCSFACKQLLDIHRYSFANTLALL